MKKFISINFYLVIFSFAIFSLKNLVTITGYHIPPMMGFVFTASTIFLIFERKIITGFKKNFIPSLKISIPVILLYTILIFQLKFLNSFFIFTSLLLSYKFSTLLFERKYYIKIFYHLITLSMVILFILKNFDSIGIVITFIITLIIQIIIFKFLRSFYKTIEISSTDTFFYTNLLGAIVFTSLYLLNKPSTTPFINSNQKFYLFFYIFIFNFLISYLCIKFDFKKDDLKKSLSIIPLLILLILEFSLLTLITFILLFFLEIFNFSQTNKKKGILISELIALITMVSIIFSLLIPSIKLAQNKFILYTDCKKLNENKNTIKNIYKVGSRYIKFIDEKPFAIYSKINNSYKYFIIE